MRRPRELQRLRELFRSHPVVTMVGPRQCGKTTLARELARTDPKRWGRVTHFDLEDARDLARFDNPHLALEGLEGLVNIDEIQRRPELFPTLRVLVDREPRRRRFLMLGSASGELLRQSSESLAGRTAFVELTPFSHHEVPSVSRLWLRGGFPRAYLARSERSGSQAVLCYEVTDRNGTEGANLGIQENVRVIRERKHRLGPRSELTRGRDIQNDPRNRVAAMFGLHASLTLSTRTLEACRRAVPDGTGFHIHVAEHEVDEYDSLAKSGLRVVDRLKRRRHPGIAIHGSTYCSC